MICFFIRVISLFSALWDTSSDDQDGTKAFHLNSRLKTCDRLCCAYVLRTNVGHDDWPTFPESNQAIPTRKCRFKRVTDCPGSPKLGEAGEHKKIRTRIWDVNLVTER